MSETSSTDTRPTRRSIPRRALSAVGRGLFRPSVLTAVYLLVLTVMAELAPLHNDGDATLDADPADVARWLLLRFGDTFLRLELVLSFTAIGIGALLGNVAGAAIRLRRHVANAPPLRRSVFVLSSFALAAVLHAAIWAHGVAVAPQAYSPSWYAAGGLSRAIQVFVTDGLGPRGTAALLFALVVFVLPPPWRYRAVVATATRAIRSRPIVAAIAGAAFVFMAVAPWLYAPRAAATQTVPSAAPPREKAGPNILVIGADSFRADAFNERATPNLWRLGSRGTNFTNAYVTIPRTDPSWATLLTGRYPDRHQITSIFTRGEHMRAKLDAFPARLAKAGYSTLAITDAAVQVFRYGDAGFSEVLAPDVTFPAFIEAAGVSRATPVLPFLRSSAARRALPILRNTAVTADPSAVADEAIDHLRRTGPQRPWFLTVFFTEPHFPYAAPAPFYSRFTDREYRGRYKYDKPTYVSRYDDGSPGEIARLRALYDGTLAAVDDAASRILDEVRRRGEEENTIVVILGDHGEDLFDHGWIGHGDSLFCDHQVHIPLAIVDPRERRASTSPLLVRDVDLAPTLYELAGIAPPSDLDGRSVVPAMRGAALEPVPIFSATEIWLGPVPGLADDLRMKYPGMQGYVEVEPNGDRMVLRKSMDGLTTAARHRMMFDGRWKLLYLPLPHEVRWLLFDTTTDPFGEKDVAAGHPEIVERMKAQLWAWMLRDPNLEERRGFLAPKGIVVPEIDGPSLVAR